MKKRIIFLIGFAVLLTISIFFYLRQKKIASAEKLPFNRQEKIMQNPKYEENRKKYRYSTDIFIPSERSNVKGVSTEKGKVLADTTGQMYIQYLPLPGKANFSSNQFNGTATINYPLKVPKGPGGFTPAVAINYSSASVDELLHGSRNQDTAYHLNQSGPLGMGWSISSSEGAINIDDHGSDNPCLWTYSISFSGGSAEMFKVDASGNPLAKCNWGHDAGDPTYYWKLNQTWIDAKAWRTNPELFLKIEQGWASDLFPGDPDFSFPTGFTKYGENYYSDNTNAQNYANAERFDVWKVATPDGSTYVFGSGKTPHHLLNRFATLDNSGAYVFKNLCGYVRLNAYKLYLAQNVFGERMKFKYLKKYAGICPNDSTTYEAGVVRADIAEIDYGVNKIVFNYNFHRNDYALVDAATGNYVSITKTGPGTYSPSTANSVNATDKALSSINVYAGNNLTRIYNFSYWDSWTTTDTWVQGITNCYSIGIPGFTTFQQFGYYTLNDGVQSFHLHLKTIEEVAGSGMSLPKQSFTYQSIAYPVTYVATTAAGFTCRGVATSTVSSKNSVYLKKADNGFGGSAEYIFDAERIRDKVYEQDGGNFTDNDFSGFSCNNYCETNTMSKCTDNIGGCDPERFEKDWKLRNQSLLRARLNKIKVNDGMGNTIESVYDYGSNRLCCTNPHIDPKRQQNPSFKNIFYAAA